MKKVTLILTLLFTAICFSQNESSGSIATSITTPSPTSGETFRFGSGLVTQLDSGSNFGFTNSRWFSMGRLSTGSQTVYGLRFQLPNRALTMGYQDINDANPRLQWIGGSSFSGTDFEFRAANSFTSTSSTLVATMTNDGKTFFGAPLSSTITKVGIDYGDVGSSRTGLTVENGNPVNAYIATGIRSVNNVGGYRKIGVDILGTSTAGTAYDNIGVNIRLDGASINTGINTFVTGSTTGSTYGFRGSITGLSGITPTGFGAAVYGSSATTSNRYAGYFNGNVFTTGTYLPSDKKLKEEINEENNALERLVQLNGVSYKFKSNDHLNLPSELQHGFTAQNIEEIFPELITTIKKPIFDKDNKEVDVYEYKAVNYTGLISILTTSLKEMNGKMEALETELEDMKREVASSGKAKLDNENDIEEVGFSMEQNRPNPFTSQTTINYTLPSDTKATIAIVDLSGKFIREYNLLSEKGQLIINSSDIGKGIFIYSLISGNEVMISKKMIVR